MYIKAPRFLRRQAQFIKGHFRLQYFNYGIVFLVFNDFFSLKGSCHNQLSVLASIKTKPKHVSISEPEKISTQRNNTETTGDNTNDSSCKNKNTTRKELDEDDFSDLEEKGSTSGKKFSEKFSTSFCCFNYDNDQ